MDIVCSNNVSDIVHYTTVSSDGWNGVLAQGNFQTTRTLGEMCTKKWRLCGKIKKVI